MPPGSAEDDLIARYFAPLAGSAGLGLRDDAALVRPPPGCDLVVTVDAVVAGVHFFADESGDAIARKALRVNLSDLAAKAADPLGFLLSLALPAGFETERLAEFAHALGEDARAFGCPLIGGDTVWTPGPLTISITALGCVPRGGMVARTGVRAGDILFVSGTIGDAALGLALRRNGDAWGDLGPAHRAHLILRYRRPRPRFALRQALRAYAHAAMDVSDGLIGDVAKMLRVSGVGGRIDLSGVPLSQAARAAVAGSATAFETALTGGDDYEIIAATPPDRADAFVAAAAEAGVAVTAIGRAVAGGETVFHDATGQPRAFTQPSYSHV